VTQSHFATGQTVSRYRVLQERGFAAISMAWVRASWGRTVANGRAFPISSVVVRSQRDNRRNVCAKQLAFGIIARKEFDRAEPVIFIFASTRPISCCRFIRRSLSLYSSEFLAELAIRTLPPRLNPALISAASRYGLRYGSAPATGNSQRLRGRCGRSRSVEKTCVAERKQRRGHSEAEIVLVTPRVLAARQHRTLFAELIAEGLRRIFPRSQERPSVTLIVDSGYARLERCPVTDFLSFER
jgi:hypothetical protein